MYICARYEVSTVKVYTGTQIQTQMLMLTTEDDNNTWWTKYDCKCSLACMPNEPKTTTSELLYVPTFDDNPLQ